MTAAELRQWRKDAGLTQVKAAAWIGVSRRLWIRYETGERPVPKWLGIIVTICPGDGPWRVVSPHDMEG